VCQLLREASQSGRVYEKLIGQSQLTFLHEVNNNKKVEISNCQTSKFQAEFIFDFEWVLLKREAKRRNAKLLKRETVVRNGPKNLKSKSKKLKVSYFLNLFI
jgi:hypothetical protein